MDSCHYFPIKQGLCEKQVSDEKIVYSLINGVKGAIRPVIATFWCKVPLIMKQKFGMEIYKEEH